MDKAATSSPPVPDVRWSVVERVAASAVFRRSSRSRELLLFICERALLHGTAHLREQDIGCGVFGRKADYSTGEDNIVRVEMRMLRKRLEEYFATEGKDEPFAILVPKGAYAPVFESREASLPGQDFGPPVSKQAWRGWLRWAQPMVIALLLVSCLWMWQDRRRLVQSAAGVDRGPLWPLLFSSSRETLVVCADSTLVIAEGVLGHSVSLEQYLSRDYLKRRENEPPGARWLMAALPFWNFTDLADARLVQRISRVNSDYWGKARVRSARTAELEDFKSGNVVLLGSARSSPWIHLFDPLLDFQVEYDAQTRNPIVHNRSPQPGEQEVYRWEESGSSGEAYCALAFVPNLRGTGNVLMIGGTVGDSTEATGEYIANAAASSGLWANLMKRNQGRLPYFEVLLKLGTLHGVAKTPEVVAVRILPGMPAGS
ncbi:MAG: hypothetical protein WDO73_10985 [Ignavibacteriota bacterium]